MGFFACLAPPIRSFFFFERGGGNSQWRGTNTGRAAWLAGGRASRLLHPTCDSLLSILRARGSALGRIQAMQNLRKFSGYVYDDHETLKQRARPAARPIHPGPPSRSRSRSCRRRPPKTRMCPAPAAPAPAGL